MPQVTRAITDFAIVRYSPDSNTRRHTMNVSLTKELEHLVNQKVQSGLYGSASEVVREGLRLLAERDELLTLRRETLREQIAVGIAEAEAGQLIGGPEAIAQARARIDRLRARGE